MTVDLPIPDAQQFEAFKRGDERALEQIYRSEYAGLLLMAAEKLGDEMSSASSRVAQEAMLDTWQGRAQFDDPAGLVAYLGAAVKDQAAIARRKHAALHHRQGGHPTPVKVAEATPTADESWGNIYSAIHAPVVDHDKLIEEARVAKKHHAAAHVQTVGKKGSWIIPAALVVVAVVAIVFGQRWMQSRGADMAVTRALESNDARTVTSNRGQRGAVTLGDETKAKLGSDSQLKVPKEFGSTFRTVELTGTAHFEVAKDNPMPFTVRVGNMDVVATGTVFTVRAYPEDSTTTVMVSEGSVDVRVRDTKDNHTVSAGDAFRIKSDGSLAPLEGSARDVSFAWARDSLVFENARLDAVVPQLQRWFDMKVGIADPALYDRRVTTRFSLESSAGALAAVANAAGLTTGFGEDDITLFKEPEAQPAAKKKR